MKFIITTLTLFAFVKCQSFAQINNLNLDRDRALYIEKAEKYRRMKNTGELLTVAGGVLAIIGGVTLVNASRETPSNGFFNEPIKDGDPVGGSVACFFAVASLSSGIPLWIVGASNEKKYNDKLEKISIALNFNPQASGIKLTYRF